MPDDQVTRPMVTLDIPGGDQQDVQVQQPPPRQRRGAGAKRIVPMVTLDIPGGEQQEQQPQEQQPQNGNGKVKLSADEQALSNRLTLSPDEQALSDRLGAAVPLTDAEKKSLYDPSAAEGIKSRLVKDSFSKLNSGSLSTTGKQPYEVDIKPWMLKKVSDQTGVGQAEAMAILKGTAPIKKGAMQYADQLQAFGVSDPVAFGTLSGPELEQWYVNEQQKVNKNYDDLYKAMHPVSTNKFVADWVGTKVGQLVEFPSTEDQYKLDDLTTRKEQLKEIGEKFILPKIIGEEPDAVVAGFDMMKISDPDTYNRWINKLQRGKPVVNQGTQTVVPASDNARLQVMKPGADYIFPFDKNDPTSIKNYLRNTQLQNLTSVIGEYPVAEAEGKAHSAKVIYHADQALDYIEGYNHAKDQMQNTLRQINARKAKTKNPTELAKLNQMAQQANDDFFKDPDVQNYTSNIQKARDEFVSTQTYLQKYPKVYDQELHKAAVEQHYQDFESTSRRWLGTPVPAYGVTMLNNLSRGFLDVGKEAVKSLKTIPNLLGLQSGESLLTGLQQIDRDWDTLMYGHQDPRKKVVGYEDIPESLKNLSHELGVDEEVFGEYGKPVTNYNFLGDITGSTQVMGNVLGQAVEMELIGGVFGAASSRLGQSALVRDLQTNPFKNPIAISEKAKEKIGIFGTSYAGTYGTNYQQAREAGLSEDDAHTYANLSSAGTSLTEMINPDARAVNKALGRKTSEEIMQLSSILKNTKLTPNQRILQFGVKFLEHNVPEVVEEWADVVKQHGLDAAYQINTTGQSFAEDSEQTIIQTFIGMIPMSIKGAIAHNNRATKRALWQVGTNPQMIQNYYDNILNNPDKPVTDQKQIEKITARQNQDMKVANTMNEIIRGQRTHTDDGRELTVKELQNNAYNEFNARKLDQDASLSSDPVHKEQLKKSAQGHRDIISTETDDKKPVYIIDGELMEKDNFKDFIENDPDFVDHPDEHPVQIHNDPEMAAWYNDKMKGTLTPDKKAAINLNQTRQDDLARKIEDIEHQLSDIPAPAKDLAVDNYKKNIQAIGERTDISPQEKEKLKEQEDARHAQEIADLEKVPDENAARRVELTQQLEARKRELDLAKKDHAKITGAGATATDEQKAEIISPATGPTIVHNTFDTSLLPPVQQQENIPVEDKITVGDMIDKVGSYKGEKGRFYMDGQTVIFKPEGKNREYELGNIDQIKATPINDFDITHEQSVVIANEKGNIEVRGKEYVNNYSNPLAAINHDKEGNVVSVNLETPDGEKRTFRGNIAEDLAYQIHLKEITKDNETQSQFEQFINEDPEAAKQIEDARLPETTAKPTAENDAPVSREKIEPKPAAAAVVITAPAEKKKAETEVPALQNVNIATQTTTTGSEAANIQPGGQPANIAVKEQPGQQEQPAGADLEQIPFEQRTDDQHADFIKQKFSREFVAKGVPQDHVDAAIALMDARARIANPDNPAAWYRKIQDIGNGEFQQKIAARRGVIRRGATETLANGRKIIHALDAPNFTTAVHEFAHVFEDELTPEQRQAIQKAFKHKEWSTDTSEAFAKSFETYLKEGKAPNAELRSIFEQAKQWITDIYRKLSKGTAAITPEVRGVFDTMFAGEKGVVPEGFDWEAVFKQSPEDMAAAQALENKKTDTTDKVNSISKTFDDKIAENEKQIEDWQSRKYKGNTGVVYKGGDDIHGEGASIGAINEKRRSNKIKGFQNQIEALKKAKEILANYDVNREGDILDNIKNDFKQEDYLRKGKKMSYAQQAILDDAYDKVIKELQPQQAAVKVTPQGVAAAKVTAPTKEAPLPERPSNSERIKPVTAGTGVRGYHPSETMRFMQGTGNNAVTLVVEPAYKKEYSRQLEEARKRQGKKNPSFNHVLKDIAKVFRDTAGNDVIVDLRGIDTEQPIEGIINDLQNKSATGKSVLEKARQVDQGAIMHDPYLAALHYFANGNTVNSGAIAEILGRKKMIGRRRGVSDEIRVRKESGMINEKGPSISELAHQLWETAGMEGDDNAFKIAIENVILEHDSPRSAATQLVGSLETAKSGLTQDEINDIQDHQLRELQKIVQDMPEDQQNELMDFLQNYPGQYSVVDWDSVKEATGGFDPKYLSLIDNRFDLQQSVDDLIKRYTEAQPQQNREGGLPAHVPGEDIRGAEAETGGTGAPTEPPAEQPEGQDLIEAHRQIDEQIAAAQDEHDAATAELQKYMKEKGLKPFYPLGTDSEYDKLRRRTFATGGEVDRLEDIKDDLPEIPEEPAPPAEVYQKTMAGGEPNAHGVYIEGTPGVESRNLPIKNSALDRAEIQFTQLENGKWISSYSVNLLPEGGGRGSGLSRGRNGDGEFDTRQEAVADAAQRIKDFLEKNPTKHNAAIEKWIDKALQEPEMPPVNEAHKVATEYGFSAKQNDSGDYEITNRLGNKVATIKNVKGRYNILDSGGTKIASDPNLERGIRDLIEKHFATTKDSKPTKSYVAKAIADGKYQQAISEGRMTANDAKAIIEGVGLEVPSDISEKPTQPPNTLFQTDEEKTAAAQVNAAQKEYNKATRKLQAAKDRIADTTSTQASLINQFENKEPLSTQGGLFGNIGREEAKSFLDPLRQRVKETKAALDQATTNLQTIMNSGGNQSVLFQEEPVKYEDAIKISADTVSLEGLPEGTDELSNEIRSQMLRDRSTVPVKFQEYQVGTYAADRHGELHQLQMVPMDRLVTKEEGTQRQVTVDKYAEWQRDTGKTLPAKGVENYLVHKGKVVITDGAHRVLAAKQNGETAMPVWVALTDPNNNTRPLYAKDIPAHSAANQKPVDVKLFKTGDGGTLGVFEGENGQLYKSTDAQMNVFNTNTSRFERRSAGRTQEHEILSELQDNPNIVKVGKLVQTTNGEAFEIERLNEAGTITKDEYRHTQDVLNDLNDKGYHVGDRVTVMRKPGTGKLVIVDFSHGYKDEDAYGRGSRDADDYMQNLKTQLSPADLQTVNAEDQAKSDKYIQDLYDKLERGERGDVLFQEEPYILNETHLSSGEDVVKDVVEKGYPKVTGEVDGREIKEGGVPNMASIESSLYDYEILSGIREVPMSEFGLPSPPIHTTKYAKELAAQINQSGEISPLIVAIDKDGPYILEGSNRFSALRELGAKSFPAKVVIDTESIRENQTTGVLFQEDEQQQAGPQAIRQLKTSGSEPVFGFSPDLLNYGLERMAKSLEAGRTQSEAIGDGLRFMRTEGGTGDFNALETQIKNALAGKKPRVVIGGEQPQETKRTLPQPERTGAARTELDIMRQGAGISELPEKVTGTIPMSSLRDTESVLGTINKVQNEPDYVPNIHELNSLAVHTKGLSRQIEQHGDALTRAYETNNLSEIKRLNELIEGSLKYFDQATESLGIAESRYGRGLGYASRNAIVNNIEDLGNLLARVQREANKGEPLTKEQLEKYKKHWREIKDANKKYTEKIEEMQAKNSRLEAELEKALANKRESNKAQKTTKPQARSQYNKSRDKIRDIIRRAKGLPPAGEQGEVKFQAEETEQLQPDHAMLSEMSPHVKEMFRSVMVESEGNADIDTATRQILADLHEDGLTSLNERNVMDMISGYGLVKEAKTKTEIDQQINEMKVEMRKMSELADIESGKPPKNRRQQIKQSVKVKELNRQIRSAAAARGMGQNLPSKTAAIDQVKARYAAAIKKLERRREEGDYATRKAPNIELDPEGKRLRARYHNAKADYDNEKEIDRRKGLTGAAKAKHIADMIFNSLRTLKTTLDMSAILRQGALLGINNPRAYAKMIKKSFQFFSKGKYDQWHDEIVNTDFFGEYINPSGLFIADQKSAKMTNREEAFANNFLSKVPGLGKVTDMSERAYAGGLNVIRYEVFKQGAEQLIREGYTMQNAEAKFKSLANYINHASGRGDLGNLETSARKLSAVFFAPRFMASKLNLVNPAYWKKLQPAERLRMATDFGKFVLLNGAIMGLAMAGGADVDDDPTSSDFAKLRFGDTRVDFWGGYLPYINFVSRGITRRRAGRRLSTRDLGGGIESFVAGKLAPVPGAIVSLYKGQDPSFQPVNVNSGEGIYNLASDIGLPIVVGNGFTTALKRDPLSAIGLIGIDFFGGNVNTYKNKFKAASALIPDKR